jgi:transposase
MGRQHTFLILDSEAETELERVYKSAKTHSERQRHQAVLLNARQHKISEIALLLGVALVSVQKWCQTYRIEGLAGLASAQYPGKTPKLSLTNETHLQIVRNHLNHDGRKLDALQKELTTVLGDSISKDTIKRFLKKKGIPTNDTVIL